MLYLVLGRARSGKTEFIRNLIADFIRVGRENLILLVPEQFSYESEKAMLSRLGADKMQSLDILSFSRLGQKLREKYEPSSPSEPDKGLAAATMCMVLSSLSESLKFYKDSCANEQIISELLSLYNELRALGVSPENLRSTGESLSSDFLREKTAEVSFIFSTFEAILKQTVPDGDAMSQLIRLSREHKPFEKKLIFLDAFAGFTKQELYVIELMVRQADAVYVSLTSEFLYDEAPGIGPFGHTVRTINQLREIAKRAGVPFGKPAYLSGPSKYNNFPPILKRYNSPELRALEKNIYSVNPHVYSLPADNITIACAANYMEESEYIALTAKKLIRERGIRARDIVVIERMPNQMRTAVSAAFKKYGIPVFEDNLRPLDTDPLMQFVLSAARIAAEGFGTELIMRFLKTGLTPLSVEDISLLESYVLIWQIDKSEWLTEWTKHPDGYGFEFTDKDKTTLNKINELRLAVVEPLLELKAALEKGSGKECAKALYEFIEEMDAREALKEYAILLNDSGNMPYALECERVWDILMQSLDDIANLLGDEYYSPREFYAILNTLISSREIGSIPKGLDAVTIGSADRIRTSSPKVVFIAGANEGEFPAPLGSSAIFTDRERRALLNAGIELACADEYKAAQERFIVYSALTAATDSLYITYSLATFTGAEKLPSEIVTMVERLFPKCRKVDFSMMEPMEKIESAESAFEQAAIMWNENTDTAATLKAFAQSREEFKGRVEAINRLITRGSISFADKESAKKLYGEKMFISPSKVETFYRCPFMFFCRYGVRAKPLKAAVFDFSKSGTAVHYSLEKLISEQGIEKLSALPAEELKALIHSAVTEYSDRYLGSMHESSARNRYVLEKQAETVYEVLIRLIEEFKLSRFRIKDVELKMSYDGEVRPYELILPDGSAVAITGTVDRVDIMQESGRSYIRVMDYKTGGVAKGRFKIKDILNGLSMQMLIYLIGLCENGGARYGDELLPAGVLYVPARAEVIKEGRHLSEDEEREKKLKLGNMKGLILDLPEVIMGMDSSGTGIFIPAFIDASGFVKGSVYSLQQFKALKEYIDKKIKDMATALREGNVSALPTENKVCESCDYNAVCGREKDGPVRQLYDLDDDAAWQEIFNAAGMNEE